MELSEEARNLRNAWHRDYYAKHKERHKEIVRRSLEKRASEINNKIKNANGIVDDAVRNKLCEWITKHCPGPKRNGVFFAYSDICLDLEITKDALFFALGETQEHLFSVGIGVQLTAERGRVLGIRIFHL